MLLCHLLLASRYETEQRSEQLKVHYKNDIGGFVHPVKCMSNQQKYEFLIHPWTPRQALQISKAYKKCT